MDGIVVLRLGSILILAPSCPLSPATRPGGSGEVVAADARESLGVGVVEREGIERQVVRFEAQGSFKRVGPARQRAARDVVEQIETDGRDAAGASRRDRRPDIGGDVPATQPSSSPSDIDCAPSERRVTPAARSDPASPRSSGPGFASSVTSAFGEAEP